MLSFGMIVPVLPMLLQNFAGGDAARAAEIYGAFGLFSLLLLARAR